jgi:hypothetical protein
VAVGGLMVVGALWSLVALLTAAIVEKPPDDAAAMLGLPAGGLVLTQGSGQESEAWSCTSFGKFCHATLLVTASDGAPVEAVIDRLNHHLKGRGWSRPTHQTVVKGVVVKVPLTVEIAPSSGTAAEVTVSWGPAVRPSPSAMAAVAASQR